MGKVLYFDPRSYVYLPPFFLYYNNFLNTFILVSKRGMGRLFIVKLEKKRDGTDDLSAPPNLYVRY